jgi:hypothetical protein
VEKLWIKMWKTAQPICCLSLLKDLERTMIREGCGKEKKDDRKKISGTKSGRLGVRSVNSFSWVDHVFFGATALDLWGCAEKKKHTSQGRMLFGYFGNK